MQKVILYEVFRYRGYSAMVWDPAVTFPLFFCSVRLQIRLLFYWVRLYSRISSNSTIVTGHTVLLCVS